MKPFFILLIIILILYVVFIFGPSVVCFFRIFGHIRVRRFEDGDLGKSYLEPYLDHMKADYRALLKKPHERVSIQADVRLSADFYDRGADRTAVLIHGYHADPYVNLVCQALWFYERGWNVLMVYQRAQGDAEGSRNGLGLIEKDDVLRWIAFAAEAPAVKNIAVYGISMGATAVSYAASAITEPKVKALIIDCGFSSPKNQLAVDGKRRRLPSALMLPILRLFGGLVMKKDIYETVGESLRNNRLPALFLHGTADMTVPLEDGMKNFRACRGEKQKLIVEGAPHTGAFLQEPETVQRKIADFLRPYLD